MSPGEMLLHARRKLRGLVDARRPPEWPTTRMQRTGTFPRVSDPGVAPEAVRATLKTDLETILAGRWLAFGHLPIRVSDPPRWHKDHLAGRDLPTTESGFALNPRRLPAGADMNLIWELSRWSPLVRLAMAARVLGDERAAWKCVEWMEDWCRCNRAFRGWNWTSALESGQRLMQFCWLEAMLEGCKAGANEVALGLRLEVLRRQVLPAHVWFTWRHHSFGSSANHRFLGELAGLITATARWRTLEQWGAPLGDLQRLWEREILSQFDEDGGHREQALQMHLLSFEMALQARAALAGAGRVIAAEVDERLRRAALFFSEVQVAGDPWDYGDSDSAFVTPVFLRERDSAREWREWLRAPDTAAGGLGFWLGPELAATGWKGVPWGTEPSGWKVRESAGIAVYRGGGWTARWDLSPQGYLTTAAHGHLDALHLSLWFRGVAFVVDPGTGSYFTDPSLRSWLTDAAAHNGPYSPLLPWPVRLGPFLWSGHHPVPTVPAIKPPPAGSNSGFAEIPWTGARAMRLITPSADARSIEIIDTVKIASSGQLLDHAFTVLWQFAPGTTVEAVADRRFRLARGRVTVELEVSPDWEGVTPVLTNDPILLRRVGANAAEAQHAGTVSQAFRKLEWAPFLKLSARPLRDKPCVFRTRFLAIGDG